METRQAQITAERMRLNTDNWRLERQQRASDAVHQRRHQGRLHHDLNPTRLFDTPQTPGMGAAPAGGMGRPPNPPIQPTEGQIARFRTPRGHFSNPVDNVLTATRHLESLPIHGNTPAEIEARNAIEMLKRRWSKTRSSHTALNGYTPPPGELYQGLAGGSASRKQRPATPPAGQPARTGPAGRRSTQHSRGSDSSRRDRRASWGALLVPGPSKRKNAQGLQRTKKGA